jgi:hypothetical protein
LRFEARPQGAGLLTLLTVLFVGLKLTDQIDWSWWWVLAPIWLPAVVVVCVLAAVCVSAFVISRLRARRLRVRAAQRRARARRS